VVDGQFVLGDVEKEQFVGFMREYERFCGVRIISYCFMSNHFHILLEVPERPKERIGDEQLIAMMRELSGMNSASLVEQRLAMYRQRGQMDAADALRDQVLSRMWDVSAFMKLLKQRFTQWYNRRKGRRGTLWEERFKSVLVEGAGDVLATMAAYIDLNPVRAGLVEDPKDYRWCGYGEALAGGKQAGAALRWLIRMVESKGHSKALSVRSALRQYRMWMYGQGEADEGIREDGQAMRRGFSREEVVKVVEAKGQLPVAEYLRLRVRYFADGAVLGTRGFVDGVFATMRERFGPKRKDGARRVRGVESELYCMRALRVRPVS
jgi:REP element-mobilizing transposase RayT